MSVRLSYRGARLPPFSLCLHHHSSESFFAHFFAELRCVIFILCIVFLFVFYAHFLDEFDMNVGLLSPFSLDRARFP